MKLTDLSPKWHAHGGPGVRDAESKEPPRRERVGVGFDCPCGCRERVDILFATPPDGGAPVSQHAWQNSGDSFENLTLAPSILCGTPCRWHGFVRNGEIVQA